MLEFFLNREQMITQMIIGPMHLKNTKIQKYKNTKNQKYKNTKI